MGSLIPRSSSWVETILTSAARTASSDGTQATVLLPHVHAGALVFTVDVTAASGTSPTLDVGIETQLDGTNWTRVVQATQVVTSPKRFHYKCTVAVNQAEVDGLGNPSAGGIRHLMGDKWRAAWTIGGTTPSFTFSVSVMPM